MSRLAFILQLKLVHNIHEKTILLVSFLLQKENIFVHRKTSFVYSTTIIALSVF